MRDYISTESLQRPFYQLLLRRFLLTELINRRLSESIQLAGFFKGLVSIAGPKGSYISRRFVKNFLLTKTAVKSFIAM